MADMNFAEFLLKILRGISYNNLSTTNRAYQWIKNNSSIDGACLEYLKNYITEENFITQKEMNLFKSVIAELDDIVDENAVDLALSEYYDNSGPITNPNQVDTSYLENEFSKAEAYLKELENSKHLLQKYSKKVENENNAIIAKNQSKEASIEAIIQQAKKMDSLFDEKSKNVRDDLIKIENTFHKLIDENAAQEEHSIFRINFETFKKINCTFRNTVDHVVEKQFGKFAESNFHEPSESGDYSFSSTNEWAKEENKKNIENFISIASCLGEQNFQKIMLKCREAELKQLSSYITDLKNEVNSQNITNSTGVRLQAQTFVNTETINDLDISSEEMRASIEKYHKSFTLREIFFNEKFRMEQKFKSDKKCLRKVSDLCSKYVDLITLQACFLENERDNVNIALYLHNRGVKLLENHSLNHSMVMENLTKVKNQCIKEKRENSFLSFAMELLDLDDLDYEEVMKKYSDSITEVQNKILNQVTNKLNQIQFLQNTILELDKTIFNGPARQPFYTVDIFADKRLIETHYIEYSKIYRGFKYKYHEELEKLNKDEYLKMEKLLWIAFLTNPKALQENLQNLRLNAGVNKSAVVKRTNSMFSIAAKAHETCI